MYERCSIKNLISCQSLTACVYSQLHAFSFWSFGWSHSLFKLQGGGGTFTLSSCVSSVLPYTIKNSQQVVWFRGFPSGSDSQESTCHAGDQDSISVLGRSLREGTGNPLQYSCLENPMDIQSMGSQRSDTTEWLTHQSDLAASVSLLCSLLILLQSCFHFRLWSAVTL